MVSVLKGRLKNPVAKTALALAIASLPLGVFAQETDREAELLQRIDQLEQRLLRLEGLEQRLNELETTAVLSDPETFVRKVDVLVDENGVEVTAPGPGTRTITTYERGRVYRRQTINEKIEDALAGEAESSVQLGVDAAIILQNAQQTEGPDQIADGNTYQLASADLYFTAALAQNTIFYADIVGLSGTPPDGEINGLTLANGYAARLVQQNDLSLRESWLMTELWDQRLGLTVGRLDLTNYFDNNAVANDETTQFISDALVNNPALGLSENGAGMAGVYDPKNGLTLKLGYQQSSSTATTLSDALFQLAEIGYQFNPFGSGEGNYRAWFRKDNTSGDMTAFGVSLDQKIAAGVTLFARYGAAETAFGGDDDKFYSGGIQFGTGLAFNPADTWGVGYALTELDTDDEESLIEGFYNLSLTEKLALSLHLSHITEEPFGGTKVSYFVPGLRLQASY